MHVFFTYPYYIDTFIYIRCVNFYFNLIFYSIRCINALFKCDVSLYKELSLADNFFLYVTFLFLVQWAYLLKCIKQRNVKELTARATKMK